jgi:hypothetical protein
MPGYCAFKNSHYYYYAFYVRSFIAAIQDVNVDEKKHSPEYVRAFMWTYLEELRKLNGDSAPVSDQLVEKYFILVERCILVRARTHGGRSADRRGT